MGASIVFVCLLLLIPLLLTGLPIAFSILLVCIAYFMVSGGDPILPATTIFWFLNSSVLVSIPFFILAAEILTRCGATDALVRASNALFGKSRNGLAVVTVVAIMIFSAISGSSVATAVAVGRVMIPKLIEDGYDRRFAMGVVAASGGLGILVPPSVPLIVYAAIAEISVGDMFLAALLPGVLLGIILCLFVIALGDRVRRHPSPGIDFFADGRTKSQIVMKGMPVVLFPFVILGGIYGGVFTPTEAAAASVILALVMAVAIYRETSVSEMVRSFAMAGTLSSTILMIMGATAVLSFVISYERIPLYITQVISDLDMSPIVFLMLVSVILFVLGCFLEIISVILIVTPILLPVVKHLDIDLFHFGIVMIVNMELALITPPVGMNLFVVSAIARRPIMEVFRGTLPFVLLIGACLLAVICFPSITTALIR